MTESERLRERLTAATEDMPDGAAAPVWKFLNALLRGGLSDPLERVHTARDALRLAANMVHTAARGHPRTADGIRRQACKLQLAGDVARYGTTLLAECGYRGDLARRVVERYANGIASRCSLRPLSPPCPYDLTDEELKAASDKRRAEREAAGDRHLDENCPPWPDSLGEKQSQTATIKRVREAMDAVIPGYVDDWIKWWTKTPLARGWDGPPLRSDLSWLPYFVCREDAAEYAPEDPRDLAIWSCGYTPMVEVRYPDLEVEWERFRQIGEHHAPPKDVRENWIYLTYDGTEPKDRLRITTELFERLAQDDVVVTPRWVKGRHRGP